MTRFRVSFAGPLVTFQDAGRPGRMRFGVPASGPMDRLAHATANLAIGNDAAATAIEVSIGGVVLDVVSGAVTVAVAGGNFGVDHSGSTMSSWGALTVRAGDRLAVRSGAWGSWAYVAVAGELDVPTWLGHTATHSMSGFGGGTLVSDYEFDVTDGRVAPEREGEIPVPDLARPASSARVVIGPQDHRFEHVAVDAFVSSPYVLTDAYDRMGVTLRGAPLPPAGALSIPSEPIVRGSVQVMGDGVPAVLLADHQTTGGYPKIATMISSDIDRFCQLRPGDAVGFERLDPADAVRAVRDDVQRAADHLSQVAGEGRTLGHRLRQQNLIGGAVSPTDDG